MVSGKWWELLGIIQKTPRSNSSIINCLKYENIEFTEGNRWSGKWNYWKSKKIDRKNVEIYRGGTVGIPRKNLSKNGGLG